MAPERESVAASASDRVRAIVEAAERSAAGIRREAEEEVAELRARVDAARERLDAVRAELDAVAASLSGGGAGASSAGLPGAAGASSAAAPPGAAGASSAAVPGAAGGIPARAAEGDAEGARLVALNMALGGTSRDEAARYLDEHFASLAGADALLDEVYASVNG